MIGQTISRYTIIDKLGEGGMGVVYKAEDTRLRRFVAIKFLPRHISANEEDRLRFEAEAQAAAALNHPNIAQIYSIEESEGEKFIVMEYVEGRELQVASRAPDFQLDAIPAIALQIAEGLQAAHRKGVIHRDIKSSNIMVTPEGRVKIMDFGLAKMAGGVQITKVGTTAGTAAYMSPEQVQGQEVDARSDVWSFGVVLYELLAKRLPFGGSYEQAVFYSILNESPPPLSDLPPALTGVGRVALRCLQKDPASRFQSFDDVVSELHGQPVGGPEGSKPVLGGMWKILRKHPALSIGASTLLVLLIAVLAIGPEVIGRWFGLSSVPDERHLVVLPFTSIGGDSTSQPLCDGLVETITSKLTQLEQYHGSLWVVPASEVRRYHAESPGEARQLFGANLVVTGNLQLLSDVFRLTMNLVDAKQLRQLSSSVEDIPEADIAALQDRTVTRLLAMLNLELNPESQEVIAAGRTTVPHANEYYLQGLGYLQRYDLVSSLDAAIDVFTRAVSSDSSFALAYAGLGEAYWRKYEAERENTFAEMAESRCEKAYSLDSTLPRINIALGLVHAGRGKNEKAIADFQRALVLDPGNDAAYRGLAKVYEKSDNPEEAEATFNRAIRLKPNFWAGHYDLAVFYYRQSKYEEAAKEFQEVVRLTPDNFRAYSSLGGTYYMLNRLPEAQKMLERSLEIRKTYFAASNLATLYYIQGKYEEAARMYEEALALNDRDYRVWGNLGSAYYWAPGTREKALPAFRKAIHGAEQSLGVNPKDAQTIVDLGAYYSMVGEGTKAESLIQKAVRIDRQNPAIMYRAATTYEQLGNRDKALLWIGRAVEAGYPLAEIEAQPELKQLVADPRFGAIKAAAPQK